MMRTALRLATLAALTGMGKAPFPTLAGEDVFDSRQDPIDDVAQEARRPVIILRTDEDQASQRDPRTGAPSALQVYRSIKLRMEISVLTAIVGPEGQPVLSWPVSDAQLEAMLDLLEFQSRTALEGWSALALWWSEEWSIEGWESVPLYTEGKIRIAAREVTISVRAGPDCLPRPLRADQVTLNGQGQPILANSLPPCLEAVFAKIAAEGGGDLLLSAAAMHEQLLSRDLPKPAVHPMLQSVQASIPPADHEDGATPSPDDPDPLGNLEFLADPEPLPEGA